ncbi:hypothetical protein ACRAWD_31825 [Caulobacter segnis]
MRRMPWYAQALLLSQPLHFGDYGGAAVEDPLGPAGHRDDHRHRQRLYLWLSAKEGRLMSKTIVSTFRQVWAAPTAIRRGRAGRLDHRPTRRRHRGLASAGPLWRCRLRSSPGRWPAARQGRSKSQ